MMHDFGYLNIIYRAMPILFYHLIIEISLKVIEVIPNPVSTISTMQLFRNKPIPYCEDSFINLIVMMLYVRAR